MEDNLFDIRGLKCDTSGCNWSDMEIPYSEYKERVNSKCPECGSILLTEEEYMECKFLMEAGAKAAAMSEEDMKAELAKLTPEELDKTLDIYNELKKLEDEDGGVDIIEFRKNRKK